MQILIARPLKKHFSLLKQSFSTKQFHSASDITNSLNQFQSSLQETFRNATQSMDRKISESKNQLKKKNKAFTQLKTNFQKRQFQWIKQKETMSRQILQNKKKIQDLLKRNNKLEELSLVVTAQKITFDNGSQCEIQNQEHESLIEQIKKQNILLTQKSVQLQQIIREKDQDIQAAKNLIQELIKQLQTNISDRETGYGYNSQSDCEDFGQDSNADSQSEQRQFSDDNRSQTSLSSNCANNEAHEQCSTVDGSNATHRDFALPEWLQFDQPTLTPDDANHQQDQQEFKMWPQLIWNRFRQIVGMSYQI